MEERRKKTIKVPKTPLSTRGTRNPDSVRPVVLRMGKEFVAHLDRLCTVNKRSRREIIEILIAEASVEQQENQHARINPL